MNFIKMSKNANFECPKQDILWKKNKRKLSLEKLHNHTQLEGFQVKIQ